jgi:two-component system sensor histidine kinase DesK
MVLLPQNRDHGWVPYAWLIFLAFFLIPGLVGPHLTPAIRAITIAATGLFLLLYFGLFWTRPPWAYIVIAVMAAMGFGLAGINEGSCVFIIYAASFLPWAVSKPRSAFLGIAGLMAAVGADAAFFHAPAGFWMSSMIVSVGVGVSNIFFAEKNLADRKLRVAHQEIEHLAKVAERERIARDLHDVLGHTLTLIVVKSALAGKLLDKDRNKARSEIADIERVSREAITEIRNTLRGYSSYRLKDEIEHAKSALQAAGVSVREDSTEVALTPAQESVAALIMREAVTNVLRHSEARHCQLRVARNNGNCVLEIHDDGRGGLKIEGNGVRGMLERVEALGGTLVYESSSGTNLKFEFPLSAAETNESKR